METYKKPTIMSQKKIRGVIPLAAVGAALAGLSAAEAAAAASVVGLGLGLLASNNSRGSHDMVSFKRGLVLQTGIE